MTGSEGVTETLGLVIVAIYTLIDGLDIFCASTFRLMLGIGIVGASILTDADPPMPTAVDAPIPMDPPKETSGALTFKFKLIITGL